MSRPWVVLSVEDDSNFQDSLSYLIKKITVDDRRIEFLKASNASEGANVISNNSDIALILLDIVMETDDAGLRLVNTIRNYIGNKLVRIVIITGQPGILPRDQVVLDYDVNEYWSKTELQGKLKSIITTNLRAWKSLKELEEANNGLRMVIEASRSISSKTNLDEFSYTVLNEVSSILNLSNEDGGIICTSSDKNNICKIRSATGVYKNNIGGNISEVNDEKVNYMFDEVMSNKKHIFKKDISGFYFVTKNNFNSETIYVMLITLGPHICKNHINLLRIFAENVNTGFNNLLLSNRLFELAYTDSETNLKNRNWLEREISLLRSDEFNFSKIFFFTLSNHYIRHLHLGQEFSKKIVLEVLDRIKNYFDDSSLVVRFSQDTFAILSINREFDIENIKINLDFQIENKGIPTYVSLNLLYLELCDFEGMTANEIFKGVKSAIIDSTINHTRFIKFKPLKIEKAIRDLTLINKISPAMENNDIFIALQPKIDLLSGDPIGFEALIRWEDDLGNNISPEVFIPAAINSDVIQKIDIFVLKECIKAQEILKSSGWDLPISFNTTVSDLKNQLYLDELFKILERSDVNTTLLQMEILESDAMKEYYLFDSLFMKLKEMGMSIALDDFGTGYSSLQHLAKLPIDTLKIDQGFVRKLDRNNTEMHIISLVLQMGEKLGFDVIAEGIENEFQEKMLIELGCSKGQGFYYSKPLPMNKLLKWLKENFSEN